MSTEQASILEDIVDGQYEDDDGGSREHAGLILPRVMLEAAVGKPGMKELAERQGFCVVVHAPSADFVAPISKAIRKAGDWAFSCTQTKRRKLTDDDQAVEHTTVALARGRRVFGVSQHPMEFLPRALVSAADMSLRVPHPSPEIIAIVIKSITGDLPIDVPHNLGQGLSFEELVAGIRKGSTAAECVRRLTAGKAARAPEVDHDVPGVEDIHGMGEARDWAIELTQDIADWRAGTISFRDIGSPAALLAGPPGVGKTTLLRSLAKSCGLPLFTTSVGEWFSAGPGYLDSVIKQIDKIFSDAREAAPAIIFLDEVDAIPSRLRLDSRNADWWTPVVTHFLTTLERAVTGLDERLIVVAATNHAEVLDPAMIREGRLSRIVTVRPPDDVGMRGILRQHLGDDLSGEDLSDAARLGAGNTGATAVGWVRQARRTARLAGRPMTMEDLMGAIAPADTRTGKDLWRTALHEAGHAVAAHVLDVGHVEVVTLVRRGDIGGFVKLDGRDLGSTRDDIEGNVVQCLAGRAAEEILLGEPGSGAGGAAYSDLARATGYVGLVHFGAGLGDEMVFRADMDNMPALIASDPKLAKIVDRDLQRLYAEALQLMSTHSETVRSLAEELVEKRQVGAERFLEIMRHRTPVSSR
ncbi:ATP-dependent Zn proteases [Devosia lucknowensis]|uniref:ATP-dependent Zn proteases n=1 Tax=Devosia lucknowensis TaxID=1096929 RepID=A0A1Y6F5M2_9HYPH|nr:AAA family ATPase [Devosia lucknowensis]SMQ68620.1 ATP-dependent Zn proteases [Devosia lucknowensis]